jgi:hypothetical protein
VDLRRVDVNVIQNLRLEENDESGLGERGCRTWL